MSERLERAIHSPLPACRSDSSRRGPTRGSATGRIAAYIYTDKTICGFTQTHLNGTGCPDLGDLRLLPLPGGKTFTMAAKNLSKENKYVKAVSLNGNPITDWKIRHADIMTGGELVFEMTAK